MGIKWQYNPSTGKVSYNAVTGKVQVVDVVRPTEECEHCSDGLGNVHWVTEGLIPCCDGGGGVSRILVGPWDSYLNADVILNEFPLGFDCLVLKKIITPSNTLFQRQFANDDCTGSGADSEVTAVDYALSITENTITCAFRAYFGGGGGGSATNLILFQKTFSEPSTWNCISDHDGDVPVIADCNQAGFNSLPVDGSLGSLTIEDAP